MTVLVAAPSAANAAPYPDGGVTVQEVAAALRTKGYPAQITSDRDRDPLIDSASNGAKFSVWFYECIKNKPRCQSIQFAAGFGSSGMQPSQVADWNWHKRFGRVYLDRYPDPWVEMDVDLKHGANTEALAASHRRRLIGGCRRPSAL